jgi:hypothetical protein
MRNFARLAVVLGSVVGVAGALAVLAIGCGGDDTAVPLDSGGGDRTIDSPQQETGNNDTSTGDSPSEGGGGDAEAGGGDAGVPPLDKFIEATVAAYCDRLGECCIGDAGHGTWDRNRCITANINNISNPKLLPLHNAATKDGGAGIQYDTAHASQCLTLLKNMKCTIGSADYSAIRDTCYAALMGKVALNSGGCTDSIQCASPGRCDPAAADGGKCVALIGDGGLCTSIDDCNYRGTYQPNLFCDDDPTRHPNPADASVSIPTCTPQLPLNGTCGNGDGTIGDLEGACLSGICGGVGVCLDNFVQNDVTTCDVFTIKDAGGGG